MRRLLVIPLLLTWLSSPALADLSEKSSRLTECKNKARSILGEENAPPIRLSRFKGRGDRIVELRIGNGNGFEKYYCENKEGLITIVSRDSGEPLMKKPKQ